MLIEPNIGSVTISRRSGSREKDTIAITIGCESSRTEFAELILSLEDFAKALTGQGWVKGKLKTRALDHVGKVMLTEHLEFPFDTSDWKDREERACKEVDQFVPEGWIADKHFRSQSSFGTGCARTVIRKYVTFEEYAKL